MTAASDADRQGNADRASDPQAAVRAFLMRPGVVGDGTPQLHETHIALVYVGPEFAYKVKRAVRLPFLDFSTLEQRHAACLSEMAVNRENAPDIYLGVVAITDEGGGQLAIDGGGAVVEWAVKMRAFAEADLLARRARAGPLESHLMRQTADAIHAMHMRAPVRGPVDVVKKMRAIVAEVADGLRAHGGVVAEGDRARWRDQATAAIITHHAALQARAASGAVRRCHGDLHLSNIVVWQGRPTLFDALEFSDEMASVDTLYDLAFLLMDLLHHDQHPAANTVLNRYLWRSGTTSDLEALALLPLYLSCRAGIRAMVAAERSATTGRASAQRDADITAARGYLARALRSLAPTPARLVAVGGLSGTGKSTLAAALAPRIGGMPGALHLRSDLERKAMMGVEETARLPPQHYTPENAARVYERLTTRAAAALRAGHSVIVDAVFATPAERQRLHEIARDCGVEFQGVWLSASPDVLRQRVGSRSGDASDATCAVVDRQLGYDTGHLDWPTIDAGATADATATSAARVLGLDRSSAPRLR